MTVLLSVLSAASLATAGAAIACLVTLAVLGLAMVVRGLRDAHRREVEWRRARRLRLQRIATARLVNQRRRR